MPLPNRNVQGNYRYGYQGEYAETDPETYMPAFELRLYDPRINRWISPDPKGEFVSPYLSMGNNWVNKIDPDGAKALDRYKLGKDGSITYYDAKGGDKVDYLFAEGDLSSEIMINDTSILPQLEQFSFKGDNMISMAKVGAESKYDLAKVFRFAADNSTPEWRFIRTTKNQYILGTKFDDGYSPRSTDLGLAGDHEIFAAIHSHPDVYVKPGDTFFQSEKKSMGYGIYKGVVLGDAANLVNAKNDGRPYHKSYVYVPQSGRLWKVGLTKPHYIRHIKGNSSRFFFGIF